MKRPILVVVIAATVVLAGCSATGGSTPDGQPTTTAPTTDGTPGTGSEDGGRGDGPTTNARTTDQSLRSSVLRAIEDVDTYRVRTNQSISLAGPVRRNQSIEQVTVVDRRDRSFRRSAAVSMMGRTVNSSAYLVDRTLYLRSNANLRAYSSEWVKFDFSENFSQYWRTQDGMRRLATVLRDARSVTVTGTDTVGGTDVRVVRVDVDPESYGDLLRNGSSSILPESVTENLTVQNASFVFAVAERTARPVTVQAEVDYSLSLRGRTVRINESRRFTYEYGVDASFTLPEPARNAPNASEAGGGRRRMIAGGGLQDVLP